jgi:hypothetical protein
MENKLMTSEYITKNKQEGREEISDLTQQFLEQGGSITLCKSEVKPYNRPHKPMRVKESLTDERD